MPAPLEERASALGAPIGDVRGTELSPMLCSSTELSLTHAGYVYELKLDGVRVVVDKGAQGVSFTYRSGRSAGESYPELVEAIDRLAPARLVIDAEIVAIGPSGFPNFELLGQRFNIQRERDARRLAKHVPVVLMAFDLLRVGDRDLRGLPLSERKALLKDLVASGGDRLIQFVDHFPEGTKLYELVLAKELEGIVAKRLASAYTEGPFRGDDWVKIKRTRDADFVVISWTVGSGSRGDLGALELASFDDAGQLVVRGRVGSGLGQELREALMPILRNLEIDACAADGPLKTGKERHFVQPKIVVTVRFKGWSRSGKLVAPVFLGIRPDLKTTDCKEAPSASVSHTARGP